MKLQFSLEAFIWILALLGLAVLGPWLDGKVSFCIPSALGLDFCWGCGLGRSISRAFHGDLAGSWSAHPAGLVAIPVLVYRIVTLIYNRKDPS